MTIKRVQPKNTTTVTTKQSGKVISEVQTQDELPPIADEEVKLSYSVGRTINIGDYNGVNIHVSLTLPTPLEELDETYDSAVDWVEARITEKVEEIQTKVDEE